MNISLKAFSTVQEILNNLKLASEKGATIKNLLVLYNPIIPETFFIKYDIEFMAAGERKMEGRLTQIDTYGVPMDINDQFDNVYQRYAFLGDCVPISVADLKIN